MFVDARMQSGYTQAKRNDVHGTVFGSDGKAVQHLFGKWTEGIYSGAACSVRCVWRPGSIRHVYAQRFFIVADGPLKMQDVKTTDQTAGHEKAGPEIARPENARPPTWF